MNRIFIYGAGQMGEKIYNNIFRDFSEIIFIDGNPDKLGNLYCGCNVISFDYYMQHYAKEKEHQIIIGVSQTFEGEIIEMLEKSLLRANEDYFTWDKYEEFIKKRNNESIIHHDFTILSNNCWGGHVYRQFGLKYQSPTIGLFFLADDYIKFIKNYKYYLQLELKFIDCNHANRHSECENYISKWGSYPIGRLDDIDIHFLHYSSCIEAYLKWNRRKERINYKKIIIKNSTQNLWTDGIVKEFDALDSPNKILFTHKKFEYIQDQIIINADKQGMNTGDEGSCYRRFIDMKKYINNIKVNESL